MVELLKNLKRLKYIFRRPCALVELSSFGHLSALPACILRLMLLPKYLHTVIFNHKVQWSIKFLKNHIIAANPYKKFNIITTGTRKSSSRQFEESGVGIFEEKYFTVFWHLEIAIYLIFNIWYLEIAIMKEWLTLFQISRLSSLVVLCWCLLWYMACFRIGLELRSDLSLHNLSQAKSMFLRLSAIELVFSRYYLSFKLPLWQ